MEYDLVVLAIGSRAVIDIPGVELSDRPEAIKLSGKQVAVRYGGDCIRARKIQTAFEEGYKAALY